MKGTARWATGWQDWRKGERVGWVAICSENATRAGLVSNGQAMVGAGCF